MSDQFFSARPRLVSPSSDPCDITQPVRVPTRRVHIQARRVDGEPVSMDKQVPATPLFEAAFGAFARGTILQGKHGLIAIEDLTPGDLLLTADGRHEPVLWVGAMDYAPSPKVARMPLVQVMPEAFGLARPETSVTLGPFARVLHSPPDQPGVFAKGKVMSPAAAFVDGDTVIDTLPPTDVKLYHVGVSRHAALIAGGLEIESFHPGVQPLKDLPQTMRHLFRDLFPHVAALPEFGPLHYARADRATSLAL